MSQLTCEVSRDELDYGVDGICQMANHRAIGHHKHYCENAARCEIVINDTPYLSCYDCLSDLVELGVITDG